MMWRGPLQQYPLEDLLRSAATERLTGALEVRGDLRGTIHLDEGQLYFAALHDTPVPPGLAAAARPTEQALRAHITTVVAALLPVRTGSFQHHPPYHPLGRHPDGVRCRLRIGEVLATAGDRAPRDEALDPWAGGLLRLGPARGEVRLTEDMWAAVTAMAFPTEVHHLAERLGWEAGRAAAALADLAAQQLIRREVSTPDAAPADARATTEGPADLGPAGTADAPAPPGIRWDGRTDLRARPLVPLAIAPAPPVEAAAAFSTAAPTPAPTAVADRPSAVATEDRRRSALGRLISSLRQ